MAVTGVELVSDEVFADGEVFSDLGPMRIRRYVLDLAFDPGATENAAIVDLELAPRDGDGLVRARSRACIVAPENPDVTCSLLVEVPNRGNQLVPAQLNRARVKDLAENPAHHGDGFVFRQGFALATIGWQWDVPATGNNFWFEAPRAVTPEGAAPAGQTIVQLRPHKPTTTMPLGDLGEPCYPAADLQEAGARLIVREFEDGPDHEIPRAQWQFARDRDGAVSASGQHVYLADGFVPGCFYIVVYSTDRAPVVGTGLLALRDVGSWLRHDAGSRIDHALAFGVSQTGRVLRTFTHLGLNQDAEGRTVYDGMLVHIGGGQRGDFNHRFGRPGAIGAPSFGQLPPFSTTATQDPKSGVAAGLFDASEALDCVPKTFIVNTSWEYWRGDASLNHHDLLAASDLPEHADARHFLIAGAHHINGIFPATNRLLDGIKTERTITMVNHAPVVRALLVALRKWVAGAASPPPSMVPRIADGTACSRAQVLADAAAIGALPTLAPDRLGVLRQLELDAKQADGVAEYPVIEGEAYPCLVSRINADGNEVAGIRLPDVSVPVATHSGWNPRHADNGAADQMATFCGFSEPFAATEAVRAGTDARASVASRYADRDEYLALVTQATEELVAQRLVVADDRDWVIANAVRIYDHVMS